MTAAASAAELLAGDRILEVVTLLFVRTDEKDWDGVRACLADEVDFDMTSLAGGESRRVAADEIVNGWRTGLAPITAVHHQVGNFRIHHDGDGAAVACYGIAYHYLPNPTGYNTRTFVGTYDLHLRASGDTWVIDAFRFNLKFIDGNRDLEGDARAMRPGADPRKV